MQIKKTSHHQYYIKLHHLDVIDLRLEEERIEEDLREDIRDHDALRHHQEEEGFQDHHDVTVTDFLYQEVEVVQDMIVMDQGVDYLQYIDVGDQILVKDLDLQEDQKKEETNHRNVVEAVLNQKVDLDDRL